MKASSQGGVPVQQKKGLPPPPAAPPVQSGYVRGWQAVVERDPALESVEIMKNCKLLGINPATEKWLVHFAEDRAFSHWPPYRAAHAVVATREQILARPEP